MQEVDYIKPKPCLIDSEYIVCKLIEDQKVEYYKIIEDQKVEYSEIIEDQKTKDINMLKSSGNESDEIKKLNLSKKELRLLARERGVKSYKNISKSRLIKKINKLKPSKGLKKTGFKKYFKKMVLEKRKKELLNLSQYLKLKKLVKFGKRLQGC